jgi:uncharacterized protein (TIGR00645 family)
VHGVRRIGAWRRPADAEGHAGTGTYNRSESGNTPRNLDTPTRLRRPRRHPARRSCGPSARQPALSPMSHDPKTTLPQLGPLPKLIFASRWLQLPLYIGLILAQGVYVFHFWVELVHLIEAAMGDADALAKLVTSIGYKAAPIKDAAGTITGFEPIKSLNETIIMLVVLALIDVVMISNLLIMVIVGGYETFVSRLNLDGHPDQPEWLSHVNASVLKVKLATAIIGISSIHLLKTFINAANYEEKVLLWQTLIHIAFLFSALAIASADRLMSHTMKPH